MDQIVERPQTRPAPEAAELLGLEAGRSKGRRFARKVLYILVLLAVLASAWGAYAWLYAGTAKVTYQTVPARRDRLVVTVSATGTLQPLIQVDISSELSGVVRTVEANENDLVRKGQILAELDTSRILAQIDAARASVLAAEAKLDDANTTLRESAQALERARTLSSRGMVADQTLDAAQATHDRAAAAVKMAEASLAMSQAELKQRETDLAKSRIYAPIDGIVLTRSVDPGQTVASSLQAPVLFVIAADLSHMELKAAIDEADIGSVRPGQSASFRVDAYPERSFSATIRDISNAAVTTDGVVTYDARLEVDNEELLLRPGMTATVQIVTREAEDVIAVPSSAFRFRPPRTERSGWSLQDMFMPRIGPSRPAQRATPADGSRTLYVLRNGAPEAVRVRTGSSDGEKTEILSGLDEGDEVVIAAGEARSR